VSFSWCAQVLPLRFARGKVFLAETMRVIDNLTASIEDKQRIYGGNARRLLRLRLPNGEVERNANA